MRARTIMRGETRLGGLWREGRGVPIVVVPGAMADAESFVPVVEAFDRPEPVLVLDRRGRGLSGEQGAGYSFAVEVADLRAWIDELAGPVHLVGWSIGGTITIEAAAVDGRVAGVVAYDPVLGPFARDVLPRLQAADPATRVELINIDISGVPREQVDQLRRSDVWQHLTHLAVPAAAELTALNAFHPDERWTEVAAELVLGEVNRGTEPYGIAFQRVADRLPGSRTTLLRGHGHLAHAQAPGALGRLIAGLVP